jgi:PAS domain-containing protein
LSAELDNLRGTRALLALSVLDAEGNLVFFNKAAEEMHGITFENAGELSAAEWPNVFSIPPLEELPVGVALFERRAVHTTVQFTGADGISRENVGRSAAIRVWFNRAVACVVYVAECAAGVVSVWSRIRRLLRQRECVRTQPPA